jgi:hypothetical protein
MTTVAPQNVRLEVSPHELELLLQSLEHCLATCHQKDHDPGAKCLDCDAARKLKQRLTAVVQG